MKLIKYDLPKYPDFERRNVFYSTKYVYIINSNKNNLN